jgi:tetratricopeptide (TPR) repeat protein
MSREIKSRPSISHGRFWRLRGVRPAAWCVLLLRAMQYRKCLFMLGLCISASAAAQSPQQVAACSGKTRVSADDQIIECTALIQAAVTVQDRAAALRKRCWAYTLKRDNDAAISDCNEALRLLPHDLTNVHESTYSRANAYDRKGDYEKAIDDYTRLLQLDSDSPNLLNSRGNAYTGKGDYAHAIADYSRSIAFNANASKVGDVLDVGTTLANRCEARALAPVVFQFPGYIASPRRTSCS